MRSKFLLTLILALPFLGHSFGQSSDSSDPSLGEVAKKNDAVRKEKDASAKPKHVFTDDDMSVRKSPIPSIALQGADNTEEVLAAIHDFRATHDAAATEDVVHDWFDEQTEDLSEAIAANLRLQKHNQMRMESAQDRSSYPYNYAYDPTLPK